MRNYLNIEKSAFRRGEYVGYSHGPWRIFKAGRSVWHCVKRDGKAPLIVESTLREVSAKLVQFENDAI